MFLIRAPLFSSPFRGCGGLRACGVLMLWCGLLSGCSYLDGTGKKKPLEGERLPVLTLQSPLQASAADQKTHPVIPAPWRNEFWPQAGGYPHHAMHHLALGEAPLTRIWQASIGRGGTRDMPLMSVPVVAEGRVFTLDANATLSAFDAGTGAVFWRVAVQPGDTRGRVIGGGLAVWSGTIFVTAGYDELLAIDPQTGAVRWRAPLPAAARAAPTVLDGRVYVITLDNRILALSATDGTQLWEHTGIPESTGLLGAASPAVNRNLVLAAFSSGEMYALRVENGAVLWSDTLSSLRRAGGLASLSDITGFPVVEDGRVYAIGYADKMLALDERTGDRIWQREIGSSQTPWLAGDTVFVLTTQQELVAMNAARGDIYWVHPLESSTTPAAKRHHWTGPVLAGGRLFVASSSGRVAEISPQDGTPLQTWQTGEPVTLPPLVAGEILYILTTNGTLQAWR